MHMGSYYKLKNYLGDKKNTLPSTMEHNALVLLICWSSI